MHMLNNVLLELNWVWIKDIEYHLRHFMHVRTYIAHIVIGKMQGIANYSQRPYM